MLFFSCHTSHTNQPPISTPFQSHQTSLYFPLFSSLYMHLCHGDIVSCSSLYLKIRSPFSQILGSLHIHTSYMEYVMNVCLLKSKGRNIGYQGRHDEYIFTPSDPKVILCHHKKWIARDWKRISWYQDGRNQSTFVWTWFWKENIWCDSQSTWVCFSHAPPQFIPFRKYKGLFTRLIKPYIATKDVLF